MKSRLTLAAVVAVAAVMAAAPAAADLVLPRPSPKSTVSQAIGLTDVAVTYSRPGVKSRVIWGGLVPFDKVWRTGANEPTSVTFGDDVTVDGQKLAKGTYSLHTIPGKDEWTVIFNKSFPAQGYSYKVEDDVLRVKVKPQPAEPTELMTFGFTAVTAGSARLSLRWEKVEVGVAIETDTNGRVLAAARDAMKSLKADDWQTPMRAGSWCVQNNVAVAEAMTWMDQSIRMNENFTNLTAKARALATLGKTSEAVAAGEKALKVGAAAEKKPDPDAVQDLQKSLSEWRAKKG